MRLFIVVVGLGLGWSAAGADAQVPLRAVTRGDATKPAGRKMLERLERMSPRERQQMLDRLPPERAKKLRQHLDRYDRLTPAERQQLKDRYNWFSQLPPQRQNAMRQAFQRYDGLPPGRREAVRGEFERLQTLDEQARRKRLASRRFKLRYNPEEQRLIEEMSNAVPRYPTPNA